jgi:hypothetical protein
MAECFFVRPRRADALAGLRIASPLHEKKKTPGEAPGVEGCFGLWVKERPSAANLHTLGIDIFAEKLNAQSRHGRPIVARSRFRGALAR